MNTLNHPCKYECSGWKAGWDAREDSIRDLKASLTESEYSFTKLQDKLAIAIKSLTSNCCCSPNSTVTCVMCDALHEIAKL